MKKIFTALITAVLAAALIFCFCACGDSTVPEDVWEDATYTENQSFGNGAKTVKLEVKAGEKSVVFTIKTDKETLGGALFEYDLIDGDNGEFGLYLKTVNGILADYDVNKCYWSLYKDGEMTMYGVDGAKLSDGDNYRLVYSK